MSTQFKLPLASPLTYAREDFAVSPSNAAAVERVDAWPDWAEGRLALVGPAGCGKSHLARSWAAATDAVVIQAADPAAAAVALADLRGRAVLIEDADQRSGSAHFNDEALFHILNMAGVDGGTVLLTGRSPPVGWATSVADLRSRLNALSVAAIDEPDDAVLKAVLKRAFAAAWWNPDADLYPYLIARLPRSAAEAQAAVALLAEAAEDGRREMTKALAREVLGDFEGEE